jgi:hypothetical protein
MRATLGDGRPRSLAVPARRPGLGLLIELPVSPSPAHQPLVGSLPRIVLAPARGGDVCDELIHDSLQPAATATASIDDENG